MSSFHVPWFLCFLPVFIPLRWKNFLRPIRLVPPLVTVYSRFNKVVRSFDLPWMLPFPDRGPKFHLSIVGPLSWSFICPLQSFPPLTSLIVVFLIIRITLALSMSLGFLTKSTLWFPSPPLWQQYVKFPPPIGQNMLHTLSLFLSAWTGETAWVFWLFSILLFCPAISQPAITNLLHFTPRT